LGKPARLQRHLDRPADKHDVPARDVDTAMLSIDDSIGDLIYDIERGLNHEIQGEEPV
jgi:hypothetical protein